MTFVGGAVAAGLPGDDGESRLLENRDAVRDFYVRWVQAGAGVLLAPTLHATPNGLKPLGVAQHCWEVNRLAIETLHEAAALGERRPLVAAQIGPFSASGTPHVPFDRIYAQYHEQTKPLVVSGVDVMVVRHIDELRHLRAALVALRELWSGPIVVVAGASLSADALSERSLAMTLESFGVNGIGVRTLPGDGKRPSPVDVARLGAGRAAVCEIGGHAPRAKVERAFADGFQIALVDADPFHAALPSSPVDERILADAVATDESVRGAPPPPAGRRCALIPVFGNANLTPRGLRHVVEAVDDTGRWTWIGFDLEGSSSVCRFYDAEFALSRLEANVGVPLAGRAVDPRVLEVAAKSSSSMPLLVFKSETDPDYECAVYLIRRYGAVGVVSPVVLRNENDPDASPVADAFEVLEATGAELARWSSAGTDLFSDGRVAVDLTSLAAELGLDPRAPERLAGLRESTGLRWALESPGWELLEPGMDLLLERVRPI